jgi:peroxiredoxin
VVRAVCRGNASLVQLQERFQDKGITVLGISVDVDGDAYHKFLKDYKIDFPTVRDPDQKTSNLYGTLSGRKPTSSIAMGSFAASLSARWNGASPRSWIS